MDAAIATPAPARVSREVTALLRVIGRGARGSRGLDRGQARWLMERMLLGEVNATQLGAVLMALRMKGETPDELLGFLDAVEADLPQLHVPCPVAVVASVNGARRLANQIPLLCLLLRQRGVATLVIGHEHEDGRLHTAALWSALRLSRAQTPHGAEALLQRKEAVYLDLGALSPGLAALMDQREVLGVRNAAHTLIKLLAPVSGPALLLSGFTHGEYGPMVEQVLASRGRTALVLHGCEGEAVPHPSRQTPLIWVRSPASFKPEAELPRDPAGGAALPAPGTDLQATSGWTCSAADGRVPVPAPLDRFIDLICNALHALEVQVPEVHEETLP